MLLFCFGTLLEGTNTLGGILEVLSKKGEMCEALLKQEIITMLRRENRELKQELAEAKADIEKLEDSAYGEMLLGKNRGGRGSRQGEQRTGEWGRRHRVAFVGTV